MEVDEVINRLNEIASHDPIAIGELCRHRVPCNDALADHPSVQVSAPPLTPALAVGMVGILNGVFGCVPGTSRGFIAARFNDDGSFVDFVNTDGGC